MWMRGLKVSRSRFRCPPRITVASYVDAWIESAAETDKPVDISVASYVDAWIESALPYPR